MHYVLLDWSFLLGHTALIFFNLLGWVWPRTRRLNLACILITLASWLAFAPWYGLGYCPCTDWHWQVKEALGENNLPNTPTLFCANPASRSRRAILQTIASGLANPSSFSTTKHKNISCASSSLTKFIRTFSPPSFRSSLLHHHTHRLSL